MRRERAGDTSATFDFVIENGLVVDGAGTPEKRADVGIAGTRIVAIGDLKVAEAARRLDATGCIVAPGFIDIHNHSDLVLLADGRAESMVRQGVTTQVTGNCGLTPAPVHDAIRDDPKKTMVDPTYGSWRWNSFGREYVAKYDKLCQPRLRHALPAPPRCAPPPAIA